MKYNIAVFAAGGFGLILFAIGPFGMENSRTIADFLYLGLAGVHFCWAAIALLRNLSGRKTGTRAPEILASVTLIFGLFSYIFATNANMDYVQRFAESGGNLRLAPDSTTERLNSLLRFCPLLFADFFVIIVVAVRKLRLERGPRLRETIRAFALPISLISAVLYTAALPSFIKLEGLSFLAYFCVAPLFLTLAYTPKWWGILYGTFFGVIQTMLTNYWLGTFSLVSLQLITLVYLFFYLAFMTAAVALIKRFGRHALLLLPFLWVIFDYLRSLGFLGYPWGFLGTSQFSFLPLIQIASLTGVWGITLVMLLANGVLSFTLISAAGPGWKAIRDLKPPAIFLLLFAVSIIFGAVSMGLQQKRMTNAQMVRIALIQQNADPRKHNYREVFEVLQEQTDGAMDFDPDLVVWSETAFVPNIRRWSKMDPDRYPYARLVHEFLTYQKSLGVWLVTGNDDYELIPLESGDSERYEYNAAVFFDPTGKRVETYRKIHLVPFTEYFPFEESLPELYEWLLDFDVYLWEPGSDRVVFRHPAVSFSTPICFEDGFPGDIRSFVNHGAEMIINISNDYWSLTEVEAQQHFANALFRAVENQKPMLRASASGVTCGIDATGRVTGRLPFYEEGFLIVDAEAGNTKRTLYTRLGDWLPIMSGIFLIFLLIFSILRKRGRKGGDG